MASRVGKYTYASWSGLESGARITEDDWGFGVKSRVGRCELTVKEISYPVIQSYQYPAADLLPDLG